MATARATVAAVPWRRRRVLPGFGLTLGFTLSYLTLIVLLPLLVLFIQAAGVGWTKLWAELSNPRTLAAFRVSFGTAFVAALVNAVLVSSSHGSWCATGFLAGVSSMRSSTCLSDCRLQSPASR